MFFFCITGTTSFLAFFPERQIGLLTQILITIWSLVNTFNIQKLHHIFNVARNLYGSPMVSFNFFIGCRMFFINLVNVTTKESAKRDKTKKRGGHRIHFFPNCSKMNKSEVMSVEYHRVILMKKPSSWAYKLL